MEFTVDRDIFLKTLGHANGIIEKKSTLPILSNILIEARDSKIKITATDLDIIYSEEIYIGDRMRDLLYNLKNQKIILALELTGSLGILTNTQ